MPNDPLYIDDDGNVVDAEAPSMALTAPPARAGTTMDQQGRPVDPHDLVSVQAIVQRLDRNATGTLADGERAMSPLEIASARTLLDKVMVQARDRPVPPTPPAQLYDIPSDVSYDEAMREYKRMLE